jgi:hypothetical protein
LEKILDLLKGIENQHEQELVLPIRYYTDIKVIRKILKQQQVIFETGKSVPDRIGVYQSHTLDQ